VRARSPTNYLSLHRSIGGATVAAQRRRANASAFRAVRSRQPRCRSRPRVFPGAEVVTLAIVVIESETLVGPDLDDCVVEADVKANVATEQLLRQRKRRASLSAFVSAMPPVRRAGPKWQTRRQGHAPAATRVGPTEARAIVQLFGRNPRLEHSHPSAAPRGRSLRSEPSTNRLGAMATCAMCVIVTGACRGATWGGSTSATGRSIEWAVR
jgi:hypothetical protein